MLLKTYLRPEAPRAILLGLVLLAGIGLQLAHPQIAKIFIDNAQAGASLDQLVGIAVLFIGVAVLTHLAAIAERYVAEDLGWRTTNALRADLTRHVLELDLGFHGEHSTGELIERIDGDVSAIADFFARFVAYVLGSSVFLLGVLFLLFVEDWRIGALLALCTLGALLYMLLGGGFVAVRSRVARKAAADLTSYVEERLGGLPDLKANGADGYVMGRLHERLDLRFQAVRISVMAGSLFNSVVGVVFVLGTGAALLLSALFLTQGSMTLGGVYVVFRYTGMLREPLQRLTRQMQGFQQAAGGVARISELLTTESSVAEAGHATLPVGALSVDLDRVTFAYDTEPVLLDVTCHVSAGKVLGLLGRTGSGKTTVSRLLFRLHDPSSGAVRLGGIDLRHVRQDLLLGRIGLVTQDVQLFQGTLRDNVTLFDPSVTDRRLSEVFEMLGLTEWLERLPNGLHTQLGPGGRGLSAGEAQLVALARVFLKDPGLVILDEASSRLDPHTEQLLERAVSRLLDGRTGMVIAHRLATVERADLIMVLEDGRVAECASREDLANDPTSRFARLLRGGNVGVLA